jgi:PAS domain S-box-containing protein
MNETATVHKDPWFQRMLELFPVAILVYCDERVVFINEAGVRLFGAASAAAVLGTSPMELLHPSGRTAEWERVLRMPESDRSIPVTEAQIVRLDGTIAHVEVTVAPISFDGRPAAQVLVTDMTERIRVRQRLGTQHAVTRVLVESPSIEQALFAILPAIGANLRWDLGFAWQVDQQTKTLRCTHAWQHAPRQFDELVAASRSETFSMGCGLPGRVLAKGEPVSIPDLADAGGGVRSSPVALNGLRSAHAFPLWLRTEVYAVLEFFSREPRPVDLELSRMLVGIGSQIGLFIERLEVEAALRESEERTRLIIDTAMDAVVAMDAAGLITEWNTQAETLFGWSHAEAVGRQLADTIIPERFREAHRAGLARYLERKEEPALNRLMEVTACRRDGREFPVELSIAALRLMDGVVFSAFLRDVSGRKEAEEALKAYAHQLEKVNRELDTALARAQAATVAKSSFLAAMSHEIRTPMNGVIGMTGLLLDTALTDEQREMAEAVRSSGEHLLMIINDILDFSKIEAGKMTFEHVDFDLRTVVEESLDLFGERVSTKGLNLVSLVPPTVPTALRGDPGRVRQILINLVGNAVKFTERGDVVVRVKLETEEPEAVVLRVEVVDNGIGISPEGQARLFESFSQVDGTITRKFGGTGLGLAICKRLTEMMEGTIGVTSEVGKGSCFWVQVRLAKQPTGGQGDQGRTSTLTGLPVLFVDDRPVSQESFLLYAAQWRLDGHVVDTVGDAVARLQGGGAQHHTGAIAILDYDRVGEDGVQQLIDFRGSLQKGALKVVLWTSLGRRQAAKQWMERGVDAYVTKPIRGGALFQCLARLSLRATAIPAQEAHSPSITGRDDAAQRAERVNAHAGFKLLVAEDNVVNQKVAMRMLKRMGFRVDVVANGLEAVEALSRVPYDLLLMDCQMPEMDGFEATRRIREREALSVKREASESDTRYASRSTNDAARGGWRVPIIAMTASVLRGDREECLKAGMDDYVAKPVKAADLEQVLDRWLTAGRGRESPTAEVVSLYTSGSGEPDCVDVGTLKDLQDLSGDDAPHFLETLLSQYLVDADAHIADLHTALNGRQVDIVARVAHSLKGSSHNVGAKSLARLCTSIQQLGESGNLEAIPALLEQLGREFSRVRARFQAICREASHQLRQAS